MFEEMTKYLVENPDDFGSFMQFLFSLQIVIIIFQWKTLKTLIQLKKDATKKEN